MIYSLATWDVMDKAAGHTLPALLQSLGESGFTGVSFDETKQRLLSRSKKEIRDILGIIDEYNQAVTIHCQTIIGAETTRKLLDIFGDSLLNVTMNPKMWHDSRGILFDDRTLCTNLMEILDETENAEFKVGIEDFPRDAKALDFYRQSLAPLLGHPRFGTLIDLGHMNCWLQTNPYYLDKTPTEYLRDVPVPVSEIHVHDNDGTEDSHSPLGGGNLDVGAAVRGLKAIGFDGVATLEITPHNSSSTSEDPYPDVLKSMEMWKRAWIVK